MYILQVDFATPHYDQTVWLRDKILRKPLDMVFYEKDLEQEWNQIHLACYSEENRILGCLILKELDGKALKMRQVAVDDDLQGQGVGRFMVAACEKYALENGYTEIELNARDVAIPFYEKLDYKKEGKEFVEVGIKHFKMRKLLDA